MNKKNIQTAGSFFVQEAASIPIFIPEKLSIEQKGLIRTVRNFVENEVLPHEADIESQKGHLMPALLRKAVGLGLLSAELPEEYGGMNLGKVDAAAIAEGSTLQASFNVAFMCHTGIASAPLVYYGTPDQKKKYLPRIGSGELLAAFALTEPGAGSDAMAIKTKAHLSPDKKHYILNGQKQFITNGGFADFFTVFAKLDEGGITAFLVEKAFGGILIGKEEKKMGIHGSSTVSITFENVKVPVENLLGKAGKGHHIAFNVLNVGRLKLGAACTGSCRRLVDLSYKYTSERIQFGVPVISFQLLEEALARMVSRTLLLESLSYRNAAIFDGMLAGTGDIEGTLREYAMEAAISKIYGSEALYFNADDALQLHGGYGYCEEYGIEKYLRDSRINRIYEGTNEVNRLVVAGTLLKLAVKGQLDIMGVMGGMGERIKALLGGVDANLESSKIFTFVEILKLLTLSAGAIAAGKYGPAIQKEQFILGSLADMIIGLYAIESAYIRARQIEKDGDLARANAIFDTVYFHVMDVALNLLEKGRTVLMRAQPSGGKELENYSRVMYGCMGFLTGDKALLAETIVGYVRKADGYPFAV